MSSAFPWKKSIIFVCLRFPRMFLRTSSKFAPNFFSNIGKVICSVSELYYFLDIVPSSPDMLFIISVFPLCFWLRKLPILESTMCLL